MSPSGRAQALSRPARYAHAQLPLYREPNRRIDSGHSLTRRGLRGPIPVDITRTASGTNGPRRRPLSRPAIGSSPWPGTRHARRRQPNPKCPVPRPRTHWRANATRRRWRQSYGFGGRPEIRLATPGQPRRRSRNRSNWPRVPEYHNSSTATTAAAPTNKAIETGGRPLSAPGSPRGIGAPRPDGRPGGTGGRAIARPGRRPGGGAGGRARPGGCRGGGRLGGGGTSSHGRAEPRG